MRVEGWLRLLVVVVAVGLLELLCRTGVIPRQSVLPPSIMVEALWGLARNGSLFKDAARTFGNVAIAMVLSVGVGFLVGLVIHALPRLRRAIDPLLSSYYAVPFFVFYPLFIVVFGMNDAPIIAIGFLFAVVAMIVATINGLDRIPPVMLKVGHTLGMSRAAIALRIQLPAASAQLFTGIKLSVAYSFVGVIASEFILAPSGLGYEIGYAYNNFDNRKMYALMLFLLTTVIIVNMGLYVWEQRILARRGGR